MNQTSGKLRSRAHRPEADGKEIICPPELADLSLTVLLMELHFFVQTALAADSDSVLSKLGYGRAHHRALHFVARQPGITSKDLTDTLGISNQALAKVMGTLLNDGLMAQTSDASDRRIKRFQVTPSGLRFLRKVFSAQKQRVDKALAKTSTADLKGHLRLYAEMLDPGIFTRTFDWDTLLADPQVRGGSVGAA